MSILVNLLPDIRQAKLRERRRRQLVSGVSVLVWIVCGGIVVVMVLVSTGQKLVIKTLTDDIKSNESKLQGMADLPAALTAADHLAALPGLYDKRAYFTHFLEAFELADPTDVTISNMTLDPTKALAVTGEAKSFAAVAKLARAIAAYNVTVGPDAKPNNAPYFASVNIVTASQDATGVSFTMKAVVSGGAFSNGQ
jgi:Tfp pilus assembly protein PilN